jgi:hypothetical protein|nr:MAG TPA: hypothetical protein [Bacteriophage sp.]
MKIEYYVNKDGKYEMFFSYDIEDDSGAIVKVYKLNYCNRESFIY